MKKRTIKKITAKELDEKFDAGEEVLEFFDPTTLVVHRVNVDFPKWSIIALDKEASRLGIARQALIKLWIIEKLDNLKKERRRK